jgi:hypothetical protein
MSFLVRFQRTNYLQQRYQNGTFGGFMVLHAHVQQAVVVYGQFLVELFDYTSKRGDLVVVATELANVTDVITIKAPAVDTMLLNQSIRSQDVNIQYVQPATALVVDLNALVV